MDPKLRVPFQPKKYRPTGRERAKCKRCGTYKGVIRKYGIYYCRRCFREIAKELGFEKR